MTDVAGAARVRPAPRLARDTWRAWTGTAVGGVVVLLVVGALIGLVLARVLHTDRASLLATSVLTGFYGPFLGYGALTWFTFARASAAELEHWVVSTEAPRAQSRLTRWLTGNGATSWSTQSALFSLLAVLVIAVRPELHRSVVVLSSGFLVVLSGWVLVVAAYALEYVRENHRDPGLEFPGRGALVWADYAYLAIQVSTTFSTSDVTVTTTRMRRLVTSQTLVSFVFNTVIVALLVSVLLSATT